MKKNLKENKIELKNIFSKPKTTNQVAWEIIHDYYHLIFTYMDNNNITKADLARKLSVSRAAVSQMFNKTPNITVKKMVEIASAIGVKIKFNLDTGKLEAMQNTVAKVQTIYFQSNLFQKQDDSFDNESKGVTYKYKIWEDVIHVGSATRKDNNQRGTDVKITRQQSSEDLSKNYGNVGLA